MHSCMEIAIKDLRTRIALEVFQTFLVDANIRDKIYDADFQLIADKSVSAADCLLKSLSLKDGKTENKAHKKV